jgi:hypothetical protein
MYRLILGDIISVETVPGSEEFFCTATLSWGVCLIWSATFTRLQPCRQRIDTELQKSIPYSQKSAF